MTMPWAFTTALLLRSPPLITQDTFENITKNMERGVANSFRIDIAEKWYWIQSRNLTLHATTQRFQKIRFLSIKDSYPGNLYKSTLNIGDCVRVKFGQTKLLFVSTNPPFRPFLLCCCCIAAIVWLYHQCFDNRLYQHIFHCLCSLLAKQEVFKQRVEVSPQYTGGNPIITVFPMRSSTGRSLMIGGEMF